MLEDALKPKKKIKKRLTLRKNVIKGKLNEESYKHRAQRDGKEVQRTGRGSDYKERKVNHLTGEKSLSTLVEVKSSNAKLSKLQKETKNYRVERGPF